jgi:hypothetical protein
VRTRTCAFIRLFIVIINWILRNVEYISARNNENLINVSVLIHCYFNVLLCGCVAPTVNPRVPTEARVRARVK